MRVFLTGATGFIGSRIVPELIDAGHQVLGLGLGVPVRSLPADEAMEHFGWLGPFAGMDLPASSALTRDRLGWDPRGPGLVEDLRVMDYGMAKSP